MKAITKTTGAFELYDPYVRDHVQQKPKVVQWTPFFEARTGAGQIKVLAADLPEEANDKDFQEFLTEAEDEDLAVDSYLSSLTSEPEPEPKKGKQTTKPRAKPSEE